MNLQQYSETGKNSFEEKRAAPSVMLLGTEIAALRICEVNPQSSDFGKVSVIS
jgi:hypothetical protein